MAPEASQAEGTPPDPSVELTIELSLEDHRRLCAMMAATGASPAGVLAHAVQSYLSATGISDVPPPGPLGSEKEDA